MPRGARHRAARARHRAGSAATAALTVDWGTGGEVPGTCREVPGTAWHVPGTECGRRRGRGSRQGASGFPWRISGERSVPGRRRVPSGQPRVARPPRRGFPRSSHLSLDTRRTRATFRVGGRVPQKGERDPHMSGKRGTPSRLLSAGKPAWVSRVGLGLGLVVGLPYLVAGLGAESFQRQVSGAAVSPGARLVESSSTPEGSLRWDRRKASAGAVATLSAMEIAIAVPRSAN